MRPSKSVLVALCSALILLISLDHAFAKDNVSQAKEFMQAGMYPQAIAVLEKEIYGDEKAKIKANPTNAEAHFLLGTCYANMGRFNEADERFSSAVKLRTSYGYEIASIYKRVGFSAMSNDDRNAAERFFNQAIKFDINQRLNMAIEILNEGASFARRSLHKEADLRFTIAIGLDSSLEKAACEASYAAGESADDEVVVGLYPEPKDYCGSYNEKAGRRLLEIAKVKAKTPGMEQATAEFKKAAAKFLGESVIQAELPNTRIYQPGEYTFSLRTGEMTDHWIMFPAMRNNKMSISSKDDRFTLLYDDGDIINAWEVKTAPDKDRLKFKIIATTDQEIKLTVR